MSDKEWDLSRAKKDLAGVQDELDAAMAYYETWWCKHRGEMQIIRLKV